MELRQLRYFLAIARHLHFTRAAAELFVAQPALSQQIKLLEREVGVELFDRTGRRVRLTTAGAAFRVWAERILRDVESARAEMAEFAGLARGRVMVGTLPAQILGPVDLPALLAAFHDRYPGIEISLREEFPRELVRLLHSGQIDLAVGVVIEGLPLPDIDTLSIFTDDLVLIVAAHHLLAPRREASLMDLADEPFVLFKPESVIRALVTERCAAVGFAPHVQYESNEIGTLRGLVARGLGVSVVPRSVVASPGPPVALLTIKELPVKRTIALLWSVGRFQSAAARAFLAFAQSHLQTRDGQDR